MDQAGAYGFGSLLKTYLGGLRLQVALLAGLLVATTAAQLAGPLVLRDFVDDAIAGADPEKLYLLVGIFLAITCASQGFIVASAYVSERVGWAATNRLRTDLLRHTLGLDQRYHNQHSPGQMIERVDGDVTALSEFFSQFILRIVGGLLLLVAVIVLVFIEDWRIGAVFTGFIVTSLAVLMRARNLAVPHVDAEREASADLYGFVEERLGAVEDIRANGAGGYVMGRYFGFSRALVMKAKQAEIMTGAVWTLATAVFTASYVIILAMSAYLYRQGDITIGTVYLFFQYTQILRRPLEQLADQLKELQRAAASIGRVQSLSRIRPELVEGSRESPVASGAAGLEFSDVSFAYDAAGDEHALAHVSFILEPGTVLGVLGHTGGGKSTLTRLILRFYDPQAGRVTIDGIDLRELTRSELRRRVGIVTQDVQLISGTVRDNLTFFDRAIPDDRVLAALDELGLDEWLGTLPKGLDTRLGSHELGLSAGEAQLLALGRIFLRDPGLVILDEASSRLDPATERLTERAISRLLHGRTAIVIAHRLHTLDRADAILVLEHGRVVEYGSRRGLASRSGSRYGGLLSRAGAHA